MQNHPIIEPLKNAIAQLPRICEGLPGIGGALKALPEHFQVEEVLPYEACGEGEHVFATLQRAGWNTADVGRALSRALGCRPQDVGWGGRKDKQALTTQTFSLLLPLGLSYKEIEHRLAGLPFDILNLTRHRNKIKTGHVAGNRFRILVSDTVTDAIKFTYPIIERLERCGVPNYFGPQRFGRGLGNLDRAGALLASGKTARGRKDAFWVSSLQSALFNLWLKERIQRGDFEKMLEGDVARKTDTGGLFVVTDPVEAQDRFDRAMLSYTGPIYGHKMMAAAEHAGRYESELLARFELTPEGFKPLRSPGSRRVAILKNMDLLVSSADEGLWFEFSLPSGAYATIVMREFMPNLPME